MRFCISSLHSMLAFRFWLIVKYLTFFILLPKYLVYWSSVFGKQACSASRFGFRFSTWHFQLSVFCQISCFRIIVFSFWLTRSSSFRVWLYRVSRFLFETFDALASFRRVNYSVEGELFSFFEVVKCQM